MSKFQYSSVHEDFFILANSADPTDMSHFIWVFIVGRIRLSVSKMKRVSQKWQIILGVNDANRRITRNVLLTLV